ncbi:MAG: hypothetical protein P4L49_00460 [Desulfosporosinus sp.]|nr:hypothetical protein [Desulfosporosinus sp.]
MSLQTISGGSSDRSIDLLRLWMDKLIALKRTNAVQDPELFKMYAAVNRLDSKVITTEKHKLISQLAHILELGINSGEFKAGNSEVIAKSIFIYA